MATITKNNDAPKDLGPISLANDVLDFKDKDSVETDNYNLIANARDIPYLTVEDTEVEEAPEETPAPEAEEVPQSPASPLPSSQPETELPRGRKNS